MKIDFAERAQLFTSVFQYIRGHVPLLTPTRFLAFENHPGWTDFVSTAPVKSRTLCTRRTKWKGGRPATRSYSKYVVHKGKRCKTHCCKTTTSMMWTTLRNFSIQQLLKINASIYFKLFVVFFSYHYLFTTCLLSVWSWKLCEIECWSVYAKLNLDSCLSLHWNMCSAISAHQSPDKLLQSTRLYPLSILIVPSI